MTDPVSFSTYRPLSRSEAAEWRKKSFEANHKARLAQVRAASDRREAERRERYLDEKEHLRAQDMIDRGEQTVGSTWREFLQQESACVHRRRGLESNDIIRLSAEGFPSQNQQEPAPSTQWFLLKEQEMLSQLENNHKVKTAERLSLPSPRTVPAHIARLKRGERPEIYPQDISARSSRAFARLPEVKRRNQEIWTRVEEDRRRREVARLEQERRRVLRTGRTDL